MGKLKITDIAAKRPNLAVAVYLANLGARKLPQFFEALVVQTTTDHVTVSVIMPYTAAVVPLQVVYSTCNADAFQLNDWALCYAPYCNQSFTKIIGFSRQARPCPTQTDVLLAAAETNLITLQGGMSLVALPIQEQLRARDNVQVFIADGATKTISAGTSQGGISTIRRTYEIEPVPLEVLPADLDQNIVQPPTIDWYVSNHLLNVWADSRTPTAWPGFIGNPRRIARIVPEIAWLYNNTTLICPNIVGTGTNGYDHSAGGLGEHLHSAWGDTFPLATWSVSSAVLPASSDPFFAGYVKYRTAFPPYTLDPARQSYSGVRFTGCPVSAGKTRSLMVTVEGAPNSGDENPGVFIVDSANALAKQVWHPATETRTISTMTLNYPSAAEWASPAGGIIGLNSNVFEPLLTCQVPDPSWNMASEVYTPFVYAPHLRVQHEEHIVGIPSPVVYAKAGSSVSAADSQYVLVCTVEAEYHYDVNPSASAYRPTIDNFSTIEAQAFFDASGETYRHNKTISIGVAPTLFPHADVVVATNGALPLNTYYTGTFSIPATLTNAMPGVLTIDGYAPALNARVLIKDETPSGHNGIYTVTAIGDDLNPWVLTRAGDFNDTREYGAYVKVLNGTVNIGTYWVMSSPRSFAPDANAMVFVQFPPSALSAPTTTVTSDVNTLVMKYDAGTGVSTNQGTKLITVIESKSRWRKRGIRAISLIDRRRILGDNTGTIDPQAMAMYQAALGVSTVADLQTRWPNPFYRTSGYDTFNGTAGTTEAVLSLPFVFPGSEQFSEPFGQETLPGGHWVVMDEDANAGVAGLETKLAVNRPMSLVYKTLPSYTLVPNPFTPDDSWAYTTPDGDYTHEQDMHTLAWGESYRVYSAKTGAVLYTLIEGLTTRPGSYICGPTVTPDGKFCIFVAHGIFRIPPSTAWQFFAGMYLLNRTDPNNPVLTFLNAVELRRPNRIAVYAYPGPLPAQPVPSATTQEVGIPVTSAVVATTGPLPAYALTGPSTIQAQAAGVLIVDGIIPLLGNSILVKNEVSGINGIYTLTTVGNATTQWVLTRTADFAASGVDILSGTANAGTYWKRDTSGNYVSDLNPARDEMATIPAPPFSESYMAYWIGRRRKSFLNRAGTLVLAESGAVLDLRDLTAPAVADSFLRTQDDSPAAPSNYGMTAVNQSFTWGWRAVFNTDTGGL